MADFKTLSSREGHVIHGVQVDRNRFLATVKVAQLFQLAPDPRRTEDPRERARNTALEKMYHLRIEVQRMFRGAKEANARSYASYLLRMAESQGLEGHVPTIVLWTPEPLKTEVNQDGVGGIQVPYASNMTAIDGETGLAARYIAADVDPSFGEQPVAIYLCHGLDVEWARQAFHDLNALAVRPNTGLAISMDRRDAITSITRDIEQKIQPFTGRVNKVSRQLTKKATSSDIVTIVALRGAVVTLAKGIAGLKFGNRPVEMKPDERPEISGTALEFFGELGRRFPPELMDRNGVMTSPAVLAAIGAVGHSLLGLSREERKKQLATIMDDLQRVDWSRGRHWDGVAGKISPKTGELSLGGSKENSYAVFRALTDKTAVEYSKVRPSRPHRAA